MDEGVVAFLPLRRIFRFRVELPHATTFFDLSLVVDRYAVVRDRVWRAGTVADGGGGSLPEKCEGAGTTE